MPITVAAPAWRTLASSLPRQRCAAILPTFPAARQYASGVSRNKIKREMDRAARVSSSRMNTEQSMSQMQKLANAEYFKDGGGPLFPGTFVSLPLSRYPRSPSEFAQYHWNRMRHWLVGAVSVLNFKLKSMPNWTTRPKWKARRGKIAPTAKALYREMLEAFAQGDKATLQRICLNEFAKKLVAAIDRRDPRERVRFELVKYNSPLFFPRLLSHQIHQVNPFDKVLVTEQAVVAINSTQQASRQNISTGETVPGSVKLQDKIEYVVLSRQANQKTFETGPWRIWGTTSATTLAGYLEEKSVIDREQARRAGWDESATKKS
ncbi:hypothetical protein JDV02_010140 [Purpureocillium takamizusanense]|uniref:Tim44-like domain-containing protein n=1 Tax=Purpureocillium takamizusanense TaxID=2060973 RepID=A0A9Q8QRF2_9HYPO|nr:uncharacterized protein JDV02_010140 [Purpureocillium takamizusanense]UNI24390.1 hypothetical protein JDV02_010140 [Purpureocillium takamizusanense]